MLASVMLLEFSGFRKDDMEEGLYVLKFFVVLRFNRSLSDEISVFLKFSSVFIHLIY